MTTTIDKQVQQASWAKAIAKPASEFPLTQLSTISGTIPENLKGSLYRNGPARLERGEFHVGHWFDGDGAILAVHFAEGKARATYRYVQTAEYIEEENAGKLIYGNYGMTATGKWWQRFGKTSKNVANISVLALPEKLLALWEGGDRECSEVWVFDSDRLDSEPVCRLALPSIVPMGFHGTWRS